MPAKKAKTGSKVRTTIRVQYYHSAARAPKPEQLIVASLGFTKVNQTLDLPKTRTTVTTVEKVPHLLRIIE